MSNSADLENSLSDDPVEEVTEVTEEKPVEESETPKETQEPSILDVAEAVTKKLFKVKVDNEELEVDEDELIRNYQLRKASDKKFSEANLGRKQNEEFVRLLKTDPNAVMSHPSIGLDVRKWAEEFLVDLYRDDSLTDEQKAYKDQQIELEAYRAQEKEAQRAKELEAQEAVQIQLKEEYNAKIGEALENEGLPKTQFTFQRVALYMHEAMKKNYEISAKDVTSLVKRDYIEENKSLYSGLDADALMQIITPEVAKKIRNYDLSKIKNPVNNLKEPVEVSRSDKPKVVEKLSKDEWRERLENLKD